MTFGPLLFSREGNCFMTCERRWRCLLSSSVSLQSCHPAADPSERDFPLKNCNCRLHVEAFGPLSFIYLFIASVSTNKPSWWLGFFFSSCKAAFAVKSFSPQECTKMICRQARRIFGQQGCKNRFLFRLTHIQTSYIVLNCPVFQSDI